jgi:hypothetical protein
MTCQCLRVNIDVNHEMTSLLSRARCAKLSYLLPLSFRKKAAERNLSRNLTPVAKPPSHNPNVAPTKCRETIYRCAIWGDIKPTVGPSNPPSEISGLSIPWLVSFFRSREIDGGAGRRLYRAFSIRAGTQSFNTAPNPYTPILRHVRGMLSTGVSISPSFSGCSFGRAKE